MRKISVTYPLRILPKLFGIGVCLVGILTYPSATTDGIRRGLLLLGEKIIPSLFPFMVLSTYVSQCPVTDFAAKHLHRLSIRIWNINGNGLIAVILGLIGGYPIGAKTVAEFYASGKLSQQEASKLMSWCVNPSPAFVITAVGTLMLRSTTAGIILYISSLLSCLYISIFTRFFNTTTVVKAPSQGTIDNGKSLLIRSVSSGSEAMISICGWVLTFSAVAAITERIVSTNGLRLFLQCITEVTTGCDICVSAPLPLPAISAVIGFGGFAVIAQVSPYLNKCGVDIKQFTCWRALNGALSALLCSGISRLLPREATAFSTISAGTGTTHLSNGLSMAMILVLMCLVFIFEVDNRRKIC